MPLPPSWMAPAGRRGRVTVTKDARSSSTTPDHDPWAHRSGNRRSATGCPGLVAGLRRRRPGRAWSVRSAAPVSRHACLSGPRRFPNAGLVILRSRAEDGPEIWCRCDGGPHGFLSIAAHAHADALSVEVRHDGVDILADPGTYCYHGEPAWREWFRSTAAHNTVEVDGESQAESGGPFLWITQPRTRTRDLRRRRSAGADLERRARRLSAPDALRRCTAGR